MTLIFELDKSSVEMNQHAKILGHRSPTDIHNGLIALLELLK